jgi:hypothetical protein
MWATRRAVSNCNARVESLVCRCAEDADERYIRQERAEGEESDPSRSERIALWVRVDLGPAASTVGKGKQMTPPLTGWCSGGGKRQRAGHQMGNGNGGMGYKRRPGGTDDTVSSVLGHRCGGDWGPANDRISLVGERRGHEGSRCLLWTWLGTSKANAIHEGRQGCSGTEDAESCCLELSLHQNPERASLKRPTTADQPKPLNCSKS